MQEMDEREDSDSDSQVFEYLYQTTMTDVINARQGPHEASERTRSAKERRRATTTLCRAVSSATHLLTFHALVQGFRPIALVYLFTKKEIIFFIKSRTLKTDWIFIN